MWEKKKPNLWNLIGTCFSPVEIIPITPFLWQSLYYLLFNCVPLNPELHLLPICNYFKQLFLLLLTLQMSNLQQTSDATSLRQQSTAQFSFILGYALKIMIQDNLIIP